MDFVDRNHVTIISGFPYLLQEMNELPALPKSLRLLISGGDVLRASYVDRLIRQTAVYNTYGPSETTVCAAYYNCSEGEPLSDGTYPVGKAVQGADIVLLDEQGKEVPKGAVGELCIMGGAFPLAISEIASGRAGCLKLWRTGEESTTAGIWAISFRTAALPFSIARTHKS